MKKPVEEIRRMREWASLDGWWTGEHPHEDGRAILAYLDSIPDDEFEILGPGERAVVWPADLTKDRLARIADAMGTRAISTPEWDAKKAIWHLCAIAPDAPKKRMVAVYENTDRELFAVRDGERISQYWIKRGELEIEG